MYQLQYFVPERYPTVNASFDKEIMEMCAKLKGVDTKGAQVPNSSLLVQLKVMQDGASFRNQKTRAACLC